MTQRIDLEETEEEESVDGLLYQVTFGPLLYQVQYFLYIESWWVQFGILIAFQYEFRRVYKLYSTDQSCYNSVFSPMLFWFIKSINHSDF